MGYWHPDTNSKLYGLPRFGKAILRTLRIIHVIIITTKTGAFL